MTRCDQQLDSLVDRIRRQAAETDDRASDIFDDAMRCRPPTGAHLRSRLELGPVVADPTADHLRDELEQHNER